MARTSEMERARLLVCSHLIFIPTGAVTVMLGPLLPDLSARWSLNDAQAGYLITTQFLGALVSTALTSLVVPRFGFRWTIAFGLVLMAAGCEALASGSLAHGLAAVSCYGAGIGLTIPAVNLMVGAASSSRRSSALNLLNFSWSVGAVACPLLLALLKREGATRAFFHGTAGLLALATLVFLLQRGVPASSDNRESRLATGNTAAGAAILLGAIFFLYVGTENALGAWLASYAKRTVSDAGVAWLTVPSYFYAALLLGRGLAPFTLRYVDDVKHAEAGALLAGLSSAALLASRSVPAIAACAFIAGLSLSSLYPIAIGLLSSRFGAGAPRIGGAVFSLSPLGGASIPWLVGFTSNRVGSLRIALLVPLIGCVVLFWLFLGQDLRWHESKMAPSSH